MFNRKCVNSLKILVISFTHLCCSEKNQGNKVNEINQFDLFQNHESSLEINGSHYQYVFLGKLEYEKIIVKVVEDLFLAEGNKLHPLEGKPKTKVGKALSKSTSDDFVLIRMYENASHNDQRLNFQMSISSTMEDGLYLYEITVLGDNAREFNEHLEINRILSESQ